MCSFPKIKKFLLRCYNFSVDVGQGERDSFAAEFVFGGTLSINSEHIWLMACVSRERLVFVIYYVPAGHSDTSVMILF